MTPKPWWQSRTIWVSLLQLVLAFVLGLTDWLETAGVTAAWLIGAAGLIHFVLRFLTNSPIGTEVKSE